jgi:PhnB protein
MQITPYVNFQGKCREVMRFYRDLLGGDVVQIFTYGESPMAAEMPEESHDGIMHCHLVARGADLMGADGPPQPGERKGNVSIALTIDDVDEAGRIFAGLAEGGDVGMDWQKTFWAERFGMCVDRYGVGWQVNGGLAEQPLASSAAQSTAGS